MPPIIHKDSHLDHDVPEVHQKWALEQVKDRSGFFIETLTLPDGEVEVPGWGEIKVRLGSLVNRLLGPASDTSPVSESDVFYAKRGKREYPSRMIDRPPTTTRLLTIICGPHDGQECVLYTLFPGPLAPKELNDPTIKDSELPKSEEFWAQHAISSQ